MAVIHEEQGNAAFRKDIDAHTDKTCQQFHVRLQQTLWKAWQQQEAMQANSEQPEGLANIYKGKTPRVFWTFPIL